MNGDNRKNMLQTMSVLIALFLLGVGYFYYTAYMTDNHQMMAQWYEVAKMTGLLLLGMFISMGRALFPTDNKPPVVVVQGPDGKMTLLGGV